METKGKNSKIDYNKIKEAYKAKLREERKQLWKQRKGKR